jgi:proline dehydrogenase
VYHRVLDAIAERKLNANVSLKLTQMGASHRSRRGTSYRSGRGTSYRSGRADAREGKDAQLEIEEGSEGIALAEEIVGGVVSHAARLGLLVRIDMEGSAHTEATIAMTERLHARFPESVGTVLQSYLYRTEGDAERLLGQGIRIRLCKGAYQEPAEVAFPAKKDVDANYVKLMKRMATSGVFCGIATHDEAIVEEMRQFARAQGIAKSAFEFQMLYGVRRGLQRRLAAEGYGVRVYIPFGTAWYPYFMRRLAERPANVVFLARNLLRS